MPPRLTAEGATARTVETPVPTTLSVIFLCKCRLYHRKSQVLHQKISLTEGDFSYIPLADITSDRLFV